MASSPSIRSAQEIYDELSSAVKDVWQTDRVQDIEARDKLCENWNLTSLVNAYLQHKECPTKAKLPSLFDISLRKLIDQLETTRSEGQLYRIVDELYGPIEDAGRTKWILENPYTPYLLYRHLLERDNELDHDAQLDAQVLRADRRPANPKLGFDDPALLRLEDVVTILQESGLRVSRASKAAPSMIRLKEQKLRPGEQALVLPDLDNVGLLCSSPDVLNMFHADTKHIFASVDWSHLIFVGRDRLLHSDRSNFGSVGLFYVYDRSPTEAKAIIDSLIQTICEATSAYHCNSARDASGVHFRMSRSEADNDVFGFSICTRVFESPIDVLRTYPLDCDCVGFDGARVVMLPRCARALGTGYSLFSSNMLWEYPKFFDRAFHRGFSAYEKSGVHRWARGLGLRIMPCAARLLQPEIQSLLLWTHSSTDGLRAFMNVLESIWERPPRRAECGGYLTDNALGLAIQPELCGSDGGHQRVYRWKELLLDSSNECFRTFIHRIVKSRLEPLAHPIRGFKGYLTDRVRFGASVDQETPSKRSVCIPVLIPQALEDIVIDCIDRIAAEKGCNTSLDCLPRLVSAYNRAYHEDTASVRSDPPILGPLLERADETGNLRYWILPWEVYSVETQRKLDPVLDILSLLAALCHHKRLRVVSTTMPELVWQMSKAIRVRLDADAAVCPGSRGPVVGGDLSELEATRLRDWVKMVALQNRLVESVEERESDALQAHMQELVDQGVPLTEAAMMAADNTAMWDTDEDEEEDEDD